MVLIVVSGLSYLLRPPADRQHVAHMQKHAKRALYIRSSC
jgi:hypothetical protein